MLIRLSRIIPVLILGLVAMYFAAKHRSQQPIKLSIYDLPVMPLMNPKKVARVEDIYWRARISMQKKEVRNAYLCAYKIDQISDSSDYKQGRAYSHYLKGLVLYEDKNYDSALYHHKRALLIQQDSIAQEDSWQMCYILSDLAKVYEKLGNQEQADICLLRRRDYMRGIWVRDFKELEEKKAKEKREKIHKEQEERDIIETLPRNLRLLYTKSELTNYKNVYQSLFYANEVIIKSLDQGSRDGFLLGNLKVSKLFSDMYLDIYHDVDKSIEWADRMIEQAKNLEYKDGEALGHHMKGYVYEMQKKEYVQALDCFFKALTIQRELNQWQEIGKSYLGMGNTYYKLQFFDRAKEYYELFINNAQLINNKSDEAEGYRNMALAHQNLKQDYVTAALYFTRSLEIQKSLNNEEGIADAYHSLAGTYYMRNDFNQASIYYLKTLEHRIKTEDNRLADTYFDLGLVYHALNNTTKAKDYFSKTIELSTSINYQELVICSHEWLGELAKISKNYPTAIQELSIAQQLAEQDKNTHLNLLIDITDTFSKLYEEMGDDSKAMDYVHKKEAWESTAVAEKSRITKLLEKQRFDTVKWEDTIEKKKEEGISMWWYIVSAVVISFVIGGGSVLTWTYIRTKKSTSIVQGDHQEKKENIEYKEITNEIKQDDHIQTTETINEDIDDPIKSLTNRLYRILLHQFHTNEWIEKESMQVYTEAKEMEKVYKSKPDASLYRNELKDIRYIVRNAKWFLVCLKEQDKTKNKSD